jgi:hypothetical protein
LVRLPLFRLPLAKTKEEKKSSFPLWGNRKEKEEKEGNKNKKKNLPTANEKKVNKTLKKTKEEIKELKEITTTEFGWVISSFVFFKKQRTSGSSLT